MDRIVNIAEYYKNKTLHIRADNYTAVMWYIKKAPTFKNKYHKFISFLIRKMVLKCLEINCFIWIDYIETEDNKIADCLSRFKKNPFQNIQKGIVLPKFNKCFNPIKLVNKFVSKYAFLFK